MVGRHGIRQNYDTRSPGHKKQKALSALRYQAVNRNPSQKMCINLMLPVQACSQAGAWEQVNHPPGGTGILCIHTQGHGRRVPTPTLFLCALRALCGELFRFLSV